MYVTLLFDVEDLVDPRSDDVALRVAEIFADEGAPATMMIVGEKARLWERRGRQDVIRAMAPHDVGLHTNRHSMHPAVAEYLEGKGWDDGIAEVVARERPGVEDLHRILGREPSCWGRGGSTWGPQVAPALRRLGVPADVYSFTHLLSRHHDVHRFCGTIAYYWYYGGFDEALSDETAFEEAWGRALDHLAANARAGIPWLGLFVCHPTTVRATRFWDALNFNRGVNTPEEQWRLPEYRSQEEYEVAQAHLRQIARDVSRMPGVQLRTVREVNELVAAPPETIQPSDLLRRAEAASAIPEIQINDPLLSPAETLYLWALWLDSGRPQGPLPYRYVEGPTEEPPSDGAPLTVSAEGVGQLARQVRRAVEETGRLPAAAPFGQEQVGIGTAYRALARACIEQGEEEQWPTMELHLRAGTQVPAVGDVLGQEVLQGVPGWMHKPDLDVSTHARYTRLQSWTLKPAQMRNP